MVILTKWCNYNYWFGAKAIIKLSEYSQIWLVWWTSTPQDWIRHNLSIKCVAVPPLVFDLSFAARLVFRSFTDIHLTYLCHNFASQAISSSVNYIASLFHQLTHESVPRLSNFNHSNTELIFVHIWQNNKLNQIKEKEDITHQIRSEHCF